MIFVGEIGINHNGDLYTAMQLIKEAKRCGVHVVKFQKRDPDLCVPEHQKNEPKIWKGREMTYLEYKKEIEFGKEQYDEINKYCKKLGILWTASVWDVNSVEFMKQYTDDIPFIKIPSACITDTELLEAINDWGIPVIMSDGMSTHEEVMDAVFTLNNLKGILHCNSSYPCIDKELDLNVLTSYKRMFPSFTIGYSGHDVDSLATIVAVSMGAEMIERHITLDKTMEGSDHRCSVEPGELENLIFNLWRIQNMFGNNHVQLYESEMQAREKLRK